MLTPGQKAEIKKLFLEGYSTFRIAVNTCHSPNTVRRVREEMSEELKHSQSIVPDDKGQFSAIIPLEAGFVAEMVMEKTIPPDAQVLVPVPAEIAEEFLKIEKAFRQIGPINEEVLKSMIEAIDLERSKPTDEDEG